jgi:uncharacterized protein YndB with AHSA1/START domain
METYQPGPLATVTTELTDGRPTLVFVRELAHPPEKVWAALTDPEQLGQWAPFTADRSLAEAGGSTLHMIDSEQVVDLPAVVTLVEPPTRLEYTWGEDRLRWELTPIAGGTRLTLRHVTQGPEWVSMVAAGWHICLDVAERLLDGAPIPPIRGEAARAHGWDDLNTAYQRELER